MRLGSLTAPCSVLTRESCTSAQDGAIDGTRYGQRQQPTFALERFLADKGPVNAKMVSRQLGKSAAPGQDARAGAAQQARPRNWSGR